MAHLVMPDGVTHTLLGPVVAIGRDGENDLVVEGDKRVSRCHAELRLLEGQWRLVDLESRNGSTVNGRTVRDHPLASGDRIKIGTSGFLFLAEEDLHATEIGASDPDSVVRLLTERERDIVGAVAEGLTDKEIAARLFISPSTVRSHLDRVGDKTGLRRRSELTRLAVEQRLIDRET